jgi:hypothetical protein
MPYAAAVALMYGTVEEQYYEDPYLHDRRQLWALESVPQASAILAATRV